MTTLAAIDGCEKELVTHINNAININLSPRKVINVLVQMLPYAGFPRVINAINICKHVFDKRNVDYKK